MKPCFGFHPPAAPLRPFIEGIWYWEGSELISGLEDVLPTGTTELVFDLRDHPACRASVSGSRTLPFRLERKTDECLLGIHFKPGGAYPFLGLPAAELKDLETDLGSLWGGEAEILRERLLALVTWPERIRVLETLLLERLRRAPAFRPEVTFALRCLDRSPGTSSAQIAERAGLSQRRLIQLFNDHVGLTPKLFARLNRFQAALRTIQNQVRPDWLDTALGGGYADQAHFNHEFREFAGVTPTEYLKRLTPHLNHLNAEA